MNCHFPQMCMKCKVLMKCKPGWAFYLYSINLNFRNKKNNLNFRGGKKPKFRKQKPYYAKETFKDYHSPLKNARFWRRRRSFILCSSIQKASLLVFFCLHCKIIKSLCFILRQLLMLVLTFGMLSNCCHHKSGICSLWKAWVCK